MVKLKNQCCQLKKVNKSRAEKCMHLEKEFSKTKGDRRTEISNLTENLKKKEKVNQALHYNNKQLSTCCSDLKELASINAEKVACLDKSLIG